MSSPKPECRIHERRPVTVLTTCKPNFGGQTTTVTVKNLSRGGIGLLTSKECEVGSMLLVQIRNAIKMVSVAHVRPDGNQWYVGCRFLGRLTDSDFATLLGPEDDLRKSEREQLTVVTMCRPNSGDATFAARIRNVSTEGVGLLAVKPLDVGETVAIDLGATTKVALVSFARKEEEQEQWLIGCRFVGPLTPEELASVMAVCNDPQPPGTME